MRIICFIFLLLSSSDAFAGRGESSGILWFFIIIFGFTIFSWISGFIENEKREERARLRKKENDIKYAKERVFIKNNINSIKQKLYHNTSIEKIMRSEHPLLAALDDDFDKDNALRVFSEIKTENSSLMDRIEDIKRVKKIYYKLIAISNIPLSYFNLDIDKVSGGEFENIIKRYYLLNGYSAEVVGGADDFGVDVVVEGRGKKLIIQCKRYGKNKKVSSGALQKVRGATSLDKYKGFTPILITNQHVTKNGKEYASQAGVKVIERDQLLKMLLGNVSSFKYEQALRIIRKVKNLRCLYDYINLMNEINRSIDVKTFKELCNLDNEYQNYSYQLARKEERDFRRRKYWAQRKNGYYSF